MCPHCGLIICLLQAPSLPCPSCHSPLLSPSARTAVIAKLHTELDTQLASEEAARQAEMTARLQAQLEAAGGGLFPTLASTSHSGSSTPSSQNSTRKVLSLNSKTKKVTVSSFSPAPPRSQSATPKENEEEEEFAGLPPRVGPPPEDPLAPAVRTGKNERRWQDLRGEPGPMYVQPPPEPRAEGDGMSKRRRRPKKETAAV